MSDWLEEIKAGDWVYTYAYFSELRRYKVTKVTRTQIVTHPYYVDIRFHKDNGKEFGGSDRLIEPTQVVLDAYETQELWNQIKAFFMGKAKPELLPALREAARALGIKGVE